MTEPHHLTEKHRNTLYHLEQHPTSHNLEWHDILGLLREVGTVSEHDNGTVEVRIGEELLFLKPPRHKDIDEQTAVDLRRALQNAGFSTAEK